MSKTQQIRDALAGEEGQEEVTASTVPTKRQVVAELENEIAMYRESYEVGGVVINTDVLHTIRCLELALLWVKERKAKK